jgi:Xaa-Pro aminopeptidase
VLEKYKDVIDSDTVYPILNNTRTIKSPEEIEFMRQICKISSKGHIEIMQNCRPGMYEYQIAALFYVH